MKDTQGQLNFTDYAGVRGLLIFREKLIERTQHPATIVEECTYKRILELLDETIKEVSR